MEKIGDNQMLNRFFNFLLYRFFNYLIHIYLFIFVVHFDSFLQLFHFLFFFLGCHLTNARKKHVCKEKCVKDKASDWFQDELRIIQGSEVDRDGARGMTSQALKLAGY